MKKLAWLIIPLLAIIGNCQGLTEMGTAVFYIGKATFSTDTVVMGVGRNDIAPYVILTAMIDSLDGFPDGIDSTRFLVCPGKNWLSHAIFYNASATLIDFWETNIFVGNDLFEPAGWDATYHSGGLVVMQISQGGFPWFNFLICVQHKDNMVPPQDSARVTVTGWYSDRP